MMDAVEIVLRGYTYEVMDHILTRNEALQPRVKRLIYFMKTIKKFSNKEIILFISDRRLHLVHLRSALQLDPHQRTTTD
jgi:hypothetical protein